jgi:hypothetical protein
MVNRVWYMSASREEMEDLKYEYEKAVRLRDSLQKNLDRRKKLNLTDSNYESDIKSEIEEMNYRLSDMKAKLRKIQSEMARSRVISESNERSPWEK